MVDILEEESKGFLNEPPRNKERQEKRREFLRMI